jgi:hypothetical protein
MKKLSVFALAAVAALAACKKGDNAGGDSTAVTTDTTATAPAPAAMPAPATTDSTTAAPPAAGTTDTMKGGMGGMTDTTKTDTAKK